MNPRNTTSGCNCKSKNLFYKNNVANINNQYQLQGSILLSVAGSDHILVAPPLKKWFTGLDSVDPLASQCVPLENQWLWLVSGALWWVCESLSLQLLLVGASGPSGVPVGPSGESVSPLFRLYRVSYFPTFPTKWLFFLLLSYFSRFCPTFLLF